LIDARKGVVNKPTVTFINNLLRVKEIVVAINKMDLVDYSEEVYNKIKDSGIKCSRSKNKT
jgi:sulfate adenylyltransferase subunit 1